ncbi:hypothetical protein CVT25_000036 [Psilocybe cyanescens]|uniref:Uncharacterized protein n=1 Tax=Psilocybe cyanescens TaxID=93625 RepID=A0A409VWX9_PSICY|nr:hypothetical protein CVT25_000036 [Psilocybe cyanescens]
MESPHNKKDGIENIENSWWTQTYTPPFGYHSLPETSKWICTLENALEDKQLHLKVSVAGRIYWYPRFYTAIFMLLELQHLSSLAEAIRLPPGSSEIPRHMKNVGFLDQLRQQVLTEQIGLEGPQDDQFLKRWVIRLIHKIPNSKTLRERRTKELAELYSKYENGYSWKKDLYQWAKKNKAALCEAARRVFTYVLQNHIRCGRQDISVSAKKWADAIITQMEADALVLHEGHEKIAVKRGRGRPKKEAPKPTLDHDREERVQTRSQRKNENTMDAITSLFQAPSLTKSPTKPVQKRKQQPKETSASKEKTQSKKIQEIEAASVKYLFYYLKGHSGIMKKFVGVEVSGLSLKRKADPSNKVRSPIRAKVCFIYQLTVHQDEEGYIGPEKRRRISKIIQSPEGSLQHTKSKLVGAFVIPGEIRLNVLSRYL